MRRAPRDNVTIGLLGLLAVTSGEAARAQTSGANGTHDPSRMIESEGRFYVYSTGGGSKSSAEGLVWTGGPGIFPSGIPATTTSVVSGNQGVWAPDVIYLNGLYYLYYSIANPQSDCAIGLVTSPTLNPGSPSYKWTDRGLVVSNDTRATYCTIDPAPTLDAAGNLWLAWGSGYSHAATDNTIFVTRLDNTTGLPSSADTAKPGHALELGHIEASYLHYHGGYYYLFWNSGGCCDGASSTYLIHVARSQSITGPYSGTKKFHGTTGSIHGPGHIGIYDQCGASRFTYHYYPDTGGSVLGENELSWGSDGWPVVGPVSTTPLKPCGQTGGGGIGGAAGAAGDVGSGGSAGGSMGGMSSGRGGMAPGGATGMEVGGSGGVTGSGRGGAGGNTAGAGGRGGVATTGGASGAIGTMGGVSGSAVHDTGGGGASGSGGGAGRATGTGVGGSAPTSGCSCNAADRSRPSDVGGALIIGAFLVVARRMRPRASARPLSGQRIDHRRLRL